MGDMTVHATAPIEATILFFIFFLNYMLSRRIGFIYTYYPASFLAPDLNTEWVRLHSTQKNITNLKNLKYSIACLY